MQLKVWKKTPLIPDEKQWQVRTTDELRIEYAIP
jgi:hypothetical protein